MIIKVQIGVPRLGIIHEFYDTEFRSDMETFGLNSKPPCQIHSIVVMKDLNKGDEE